MVQGYVDTYRSALKVWDEIKIPSTSPAGDTVYRTQKKIIYEGSMNEAPERIGRDDQDQPVFPSYERKLQPGTHYFVNGDKRSNAVCLDASYFENRMILWSPNSHDTLDEVLVSFAEFSRNKRGDIIIKKPEKSILLEVHKSASQISESKYSESSEKAKTKKFYKIYLGEGKIGQGHYLGMSYSEEDEFPYKAVFMNNDSITELLAFKSYIATETKLIVKDYEFPNLSRQEKAFFAEKYSN